MFLVGGGILVHGLGPLHHAVEAGLAQIGAVDGVRSLLSAVADALTGVVAGGLVFAGLFAWNAVRRMGRR
jgi:predicted DNA repair protein MutK